MKKVKFLKYSRNESIWVSEHQKELAKYAGKWIAVLENKLIASGDSVSEVMQTIEQKGIKHLPLLTMVPRKDEGPYILILWF